MHNRLPACLFIISAFVLFQGTAQSDRTDNPPVQQKLRPTTIRSSTNLVLVPVSVRDASGQPVTNLQIKDFAILENGNAVPLEHVGKPELTRLEIVLVFDLTSSIWYFFDLVKEAAAGFVKSIFRPGDAVSVVGISSKPEVLLKRTQSLPMALDGLNRLPRFGAATAFFDSIIAATRQFPERTDPETRRVIIVLSDGEDNLSKKKLDDALERVQKAGSLFYSINPGASPDRLNRVSRRGQQCMETIAEHTGGTAFLAESYKELGAIYGRIAEELQVQYLLSYYPPDSTTDDTFRSITVILPGRPELHVHARKGYYKDRETSR